MTPNAASTGSGEANPRRRNGSRLQLTPWCDVFIDDVALAALTDEAATQLGQLLALALIEGRTRSQGDMA